MNRVKMTETKSVYLHPDKSSKPLATLDYQHADNLAA
jgi:hypothetical protein